MKEVGKIFCVSPRCG